MTQFAGGFGSLPGLQPDQIIAGGQRQDAVRCKRRASVLTTGFCAHAVPDDVPSLSGGVYGAVAVAWIGRPGISGTPHDGDFGADLARCFRSEGPRLLTRLVGPFAIAIYDTETRRGVIAIDRMGVHPLYFLASANGVSFGSTPARALTAAARPAEIDPQAIFDYLYCHVIPAPHSIFKDVRRLLPGQHVAWADGKTELGWHWQPRFRENEVRSFQSLREEFLRDLRAAVADDMADARCGAFLSGGTDSSTILGLMTEIRQAPVDAFSIGFDAAGFDEMAYARLAARRFGSRHHEYYVTPGDIVTAVPQLVATYAQPFGNSSALPTYYCARLARDKGIERLLAGDGGDELFGGNARYAKQRVFAHYERLPALIRHGLLEPGARLATQFGQVPGLSKAASYVTQASIPMPERLETYNLLNRLGAGEVLTDDLLARIDPEAPMRLNRDAYLNPTAASLINRMLALDFKTTLADNDLPKVMQSCELAGMDVAFPMLDHRVVDFSLSLHPDLKLKGTKLRYFFKESLRGLLPDEIISKQKHGFGLPFGEWMMQHAPLRELTFDSLNGLKRRGWVRPQLIDRLKDELLPAVPNYYGSLAWLFMVLEQWMQMHVDAPTQRA